METSHHEHPVNLGRISTSFSNWQFKGTHNSQEEAVKVPSLWAPTVSVAQMACGTLDTGQSTKKEWPEEAANKGSATDSTFGTAGGIAGEMVAIKSPFMEWAGPPWGNPGLALHPDFGH